MRHLSREERLALVESGGEPSHAHLGECPRCRAEIERARATLAELRLADVPEPSPLYWEHLSARIAAAVDEASRDGRRQRRSLAWPILVPLTMVVGALVMAVAVQRGSDRPVAATAEPAVSAARVAAGDAAASAGSGEGTWALLDQLAGDFDVDTLSQSLGTSESAGAVGGVYELNAEERVQLAELLKAETGREPGRYPAGR